MSSPPPLRALKVWLDDDLVGHIQLNRPHAANSIDTHMWTELPQATKWLEKEHARVILLTGAGRNFCGGIDLASLENGVGRRDPACAARTAFAFREGLDTLQKGMAAMESVRCPTIALVQGACFGAGVDLITACDIRFATADAKLCVKEVDLAVIADMGTLQRLPGIVGQGRARELALTARQISGLEAEGMGLVSATLADPAALSQHGLAVARSIAAKPPVAVAGTKHVLLYQRDHSVADGLDYVSAWNASMLNSSDFVEVFSAAKEKRKPVFSKL